MLEIDMGTYVQALLALAVVIALILSAAGLLRRFGALGAVGLRQGGGQRLRMVESTLLDPKHRLVLITKDDNEYLLLLGGSVPILLPGGSEFNSSSLIATKKYKQKQEDKP